MPTYSHGRNSTAAPAFVTLSFGPYRQFLDGCFHRNADRDVLSYGTPPQTKREEPPPTPASSLALPPHSCAFNPHKQDVDVFTATISG